MLNLAFVADDLFDEQSQVLDGDVFARADIDQAGFVVGFDIEEEKPLTILMSIHKKDGEQIRIELDESAIVEALINFCIKTKVPVSRKSKKTVKFTDGKISFDMSLVNPSFSTNI